MRFSSALVGSCLICVVACDAPEDAVAPTQSSATALTTSAAETPPAAPNPEPELAPADSPTALLDPEDPDEACALILSVAYEGALDAPEGLHRNEAKARTRAEKLRAEVMAGADFRDLAVDKSDAVSKVRRGAIGTFPRDSWPEKHAALEEAIFALKVNEVSPVVQAPYGYTIAKRCKVEKVHTRHVLIRYEGALRAPDDLKRTRDAAQELAMEIYGKAKNGTSIEVLAKEFSEDGSAERGGDLGTVGRGLFVPPYEEAAFALKPGGISAPVESDFGFHVIQRID